MNRELLSLSSGADVGPSAFPAADGHDSGADCRTLPREIRKTRYLAVLKIESNCPLPDVPGKLRDTCVTHHTKQGLSKLAICDVKLYS